MTILGICGGPNSLEHIINKKLVHGQYHDSSVALIKDGNLLFALEEERINRIKHTNLFPNKAINECLEYCKHEISEIDYFAFSVSTNVLSIIDQRRAFKSDLLQNIYRFYRSYFFSQEAAKQKLQEIIKLHTNHLIDKNKIKLFGHHFCHAASAFYQSGFSEGLIVTFDGVGDDGLSGSVYHGINGKLKELESFPLKKSLGFFYLEVIEFLGYEMFDEYKVMGLAPHGDSSVFSSEFEEMYQLLPNGNFEIYFEKIRQLEKICPRRAKNGTITTQHKDIAAALQSSLEKIAFHVLEYWKVKTRCKNLCLAGGVALNCKMTGQLLLSSLFEDIFVYPAAADNGLSVGAALACHSEMQPTQPKLLKSLALGSSASEKDLLDALSSWSDFIDVVESSDISYRAAKLLSEGNIIAWFNGRDEFGPRALGNRSILADARPLENRNRINSIIKMREGYRPFAPAVMFEYLHEYFEAPSSDRNKFSFMSFVLNVQDEYKEVLQAITHVDGTARVQTVSKEENFPFWSLINKFYSLTGVPVVLNTSFNNNFEPIVHTPLDAITFLLSSELNYLVIENYIISKKVLRDSGGNVSLYPAIHVDIKEVNVGGEIKKIIFNKYFMTEMVVDNEIFEMLSTHKVFNFKKKLSELKAIMELWRQRLIVVRPQKQNN